MSRAYITSTVSGTSFYETTPKAVIDIIDAELRTGRKLKFYYGDSQTGRDWMEEYDTVGTLGRSGGGKYNVPLLIKTRRSSGGGALMTDAIVKIKDAKTGVVLYQHPKYHQPKMEIKAQPEETEYPFATYHDGKLHSQHRTERSAKLLITKLS